MKATSELSALDPAELYERDFYAWTRQQARALARLRGAPANAGLDPVHLAEEIFDLGSEVRRAVESQLVRLIEHLLKLEYARLAEPRRTWSLSVRDARRQIKSRLTPTLSRNLVRRTADLFAEARGDARLALLDHPEPEAARDLPLSCPWSLDEILREGWYPTNRHGLPSPEVA